MRPDWEAHAHLRRAVMTPNAFNYWMTFDAYAPSDTEGKLVNRCFLVELGGHLCWQVIDNCVGVVCDSDEECVPLIGGHECRCTSEVSSGK